MSFAAPEIENEVDPPVLTIGEVAERTGLTVAGLRNWESRYGFPTPHRTASGQRRYRESDCRMVAEVLRRRDSGLSLNAAVAQVLNGTASTRETSLYAGLRRRQPQLPVHRLDKRLLLALTWAIEDQCCATAQSPLLLGAFQNHRHWESAQRRWESLAATGDYTIVFAGFDGPTRHSDRMAEIAIDATSPLQREWALVCDSPDQPACMIGWEPPGQEHRRDRDRVFEMVWSVDPTVVREAARIGVDLAAQKVPELAAEPGARLAEAARPASADLQRASGVFERMLDYLASP